MKFEDMFDFSMDEWRGLDLTTQSAWFSSRDVENVPSTLPGLPKNDPGFHGLFIPYIPYQMISRFTRSGEWVWDCFAGSGTTWSVANMLGRNCIANDIHSLRPYIVEADSEFYNPGRSVQLIIMHPPYYNAIRYEKDAKLSGASSLGEFLNSFYKISANVVGFLDEDRILVLVCGNIWLNGEEVTLGVLCKDLIRQLGFRLRSHIVKGYGGETKGGSAKTRNLEHYRGLKFGYNSFYGDNIFILQKRCSVNVRQEL